MNVRHDARSGTLGFSLVETLVTLALTGALLAAITTLTGQWLPAWRQGLVGVQRLDALDLAIQRLAADIAAAKPITAKGTFAPPLFFGNPDAIVFVRQAIGPGAGEKLEWVRVAEQNDVFVRAHGPFAPIADEPVQPTFVEPVEIARGPYRFRFSYAGPDHVWVTDWIGRSTLPVAVRIDVFDADAAGPLPLSTTVALRVDAPASCAGQASVETCIGRASAGQ
jgi:general secretion pathway protein J